MIVLVYLVAGSLVLVLLALSLLTLRYFQDRKRASRLWSASVPERWTGIGSVKQLVITPLIDWYPSKESLAGEAGVSYLIEADGTKILLDVGLNAGNEHPSPLIRNMKELGVKIEDIHYIVISHLHSDHVGGIANMRKRTFGLSKEDNDLSHVTALTPVAMQHATARIRALTAPFVIAPGIASEGPIATSLFLMGLTFEQAVVVNVSGKGAVIVTGCGHQGLQRIVERAEQLIPAPIYGIVGGLHYPVESSRINILGIPLQRLLGTGKLPWKPITKSEVLESIDFLKTKNPRLVAVSAHDSDDWSLGAFRNSFGEACQQLQVGKQIIVRGE